jgi:hypothetical protein
MPYEHIEELGDRRQEKYLLGLTVQNLVGVLALALPALLLTQGAGVLARILAVAGSLVLGIGLTLPVGGLTLYEWPLWLARGRLRVLLRGRLIRAGTFQASPIEMPVAPLCVGGPIQPARWEDARQSGRVIGATHADL